MYTIIPTKMAQNADMKTDRSPNKVYLATLNIGWSSIPLFARKTPIYIKFFLLALANHYLAMMKNWNTKCWGFVASKFSSSLRQTPKFPHAVVLRSNPHEASLANILMDRSSNVSKVGCDKADGSWESVQVASKETGRKTALYREGSLKLLLTRGDPWKILTRSIPRG